MGDIENDLRAYKQKKQEEFEQGKNKYLQEKEIYLKAANQFKEILMPILTRYEDKIQKYRLASGIEDVWAYGDSKATLYFRPDIPASTKDTSGSYLSFVFINPDKISVSIELLVNGKTQHRDFDLTVAEATQDRIEEEVEAFIREVLSNS